MKKFLRKIIAVTSDKNQNEIVIQKLALDSEENYDESKISQDEIYISAVYNSGLFLESWYKEMNPDVEGSSSDALEHYYFNGYKEGRSPNYLFDPVWYLSNNIDVKNANKVERNGLKKTTACMKEPCMNLHGRYDTMRCKIQTMSDLCR